MENVVSGTTKSSAISTTQTFTNDPVLNTSTSTSSINQWGFSKRLEVIELQDSIEIIYEETSNIALTAYPPRPPQKRYFKIVFSCVDGKWNKSERIYGEKIEHQSYFKF